MTRRATRSISRQQIRFAAWILASSFPAISSAAILQSSTSLQGEQYANDPGPGTRIDLNLSLVTTVEEDFEPRLPNREIHFYSFYESGPSGDFSLDFDRTMQRFPIADLGHLWVGRTHPVTEATLGSTPNSVDAIGANWVQNQSDALNPRVSGWIGAGGRIEDPSHRFSLTAAFSPIFLPSFGPRLQLSETTAAEGSRFSRLPPQFVEQGDTTLPLRYHLSVGDVRQIIFQPQAFLSTGFGNSEMRVDVMDWTAPNPTPDVDTDYALVTHTGERESDDSADVMVDAHPRFLRQHFTAVRYEGTRIPGKPLAGVTYEWFKRVITASLESTPTDFLSLGALNRWNLTPTNPSPSAAFSPSYADELVWAETGTTFYHNRIRPTFRIEQHLSSENYGRMIRPKVVYAASKGLDVFALAQVMSGKDRSYFGEWRSLGSAAMGVNWQW